MSDLLAKVVRQSATHVRPPIPTSLEKAAETAFAKAVTKPGLAPDVAKRLTQLLDTNAAVVLPTNASQLIGLAKAGRLAPKSGLSLSLGNVTQQVAQKGGFAAVVLSDEGKRALALAEQAGGLDAALAKLGEASYANAGLRFGSELKLPTTLDIGQSIKHVLVDAPDHADLLREYGEAVARGEAPAAIGGKPFTDFFRASDDLYNDLEIEAFQRAVPGFAQRSIDEQRAVAALAGRVAADFPAALPADTRRRIATTMVHYTPVEGAATGHQAVSELKAFYKGLPAGKGPSVADQIVQEGLRVGDAGRYGKGVYHTPSPTTAGGYTYRNSTTPAEILSGEVAPGRIVDDFIPAPAFDEAADVDTRWVRRSDLAQADYGDYGVTKDPGRFTIKGITRYRPDEATGLESLIPDLLEVHRQAPGWTAKLFERIEPARRQRALEHALANGSGEARQSAAFLLAKSGDARGIKLTIDVMRATSDAKTATAAGEALRGALAGLGGDRLQEAASLLQALSGSSYLKGKESTIAREVETALGAMGTQLLKDNGWRQVRGPRTYWTR